MSLKLILNKLHNIDFSRFYEIHSDPQTNLFNPSGPMSLETAQTTFKEWMEHWEKHHLGSWTIKSADTGRIVGFGGLSYRMYGEEEKLNLGYRFEEQSWGKGYATELAQRAISYGFHELKVDRIFAVVRPAHTASIKVLEKCGMSFFGTLNDVPGQDESLVYIVQRS